MIKPKTNLFRRLDKLEAEIGPRITECAECGGPVPGENGCLVVFSDGTLKWGACKSCGLALDWTGKPLLPQPIGKDGPSRFIKTYHADTPIEYV